MIKGLISGALGLIIACVGEDDINGVKRFDLGNDYLGEGFAFLPVLIGLFAFSQLMSDVRDRASARKALSDMQAVSIRIEHKRAIKAIFTDWINVVRSSLIGVFTGVLPAAGSSISNILAYDQAKKSSPTPEKFGTGHAGGIIAPESANNATAGGALITVMALGIPGDVITAVMLGALLIHDVIQPRLHRRTAAHCLRDLHRFLLCQLLGAWPSSWRAARLRPDHQGQNVRACLDHPGLLRHRGLLAQ